MSEEMLRRLQVVRDEGYQNITLHAFFNDDVLQRTERCILYYKSCEGIFEIIQYLIKYVMFFTFPISTKLGAPIMPSSY